MNSDQYCKEYYQKNKEHNKQSCKAWRQKNKERSRQYFKKWFQKNKKVQQQRVLDLRHRKKEWLEQYKTSLRCSRCGFHEDPVALDFHHKDPTEKELTVCKIVANGRSIENILKEIKKCVILCANCHRIEHKHTRARSSTV